MQLDLLKILARFVHFLSSLSTENIKITRKIIESEENNCKVSFKFIRLIKAYKKNPEKKNKCY